jgi:hypothetical protein
VAAVATLTMKRGARLMTEPLIAPILAKNPFAVASGPAANN